MAPANDNGIQELMSNLQSLFTTMERIVSDSIAKAISFRDQHEAFRKESADREAALRKQNDDLQKEVVDKDAKLKEHSDAFAALNQEIKTREGRINDMWKSSLLAALVALVVGAAVWAGYALRGPSQQVAGVSKDEFAAFSSQLAANKKETGEIKENLGDVAAKLQKLGSAVAQIATGGTTTVAVNEWDSSNVMVKAKKFYESCGTDKVFALDGDRSTNFQVGLRETKWTDAKDHVTSCDVDWFIAQGQKVTKLTREANSDETNPNADEDAEVLKQQAVAGPEDRVDGNVQQTACERGSCNLTIAPPSPWGVTTPTPVYGTPGYGYGPRYAGRGYGHGRPVCRKGIYNPATRQCDVAIRDRNALEAASPTIESGDPECRRTGGRGYWVNGRSPEGYPMKIHRSCFRVGANY